MTPAAPLEGSAGVAQFFMLNASVAERPTGVLMLGSFSASSYAGLQTSLLDGLRGLREKGAEQLIVDVVRVAAGCMGGTVLTVRFGRRTMAEVSMIAGINGLRNTDVIRGRLHLHRSCKTMT